MMPVNSSLEAPASMGIVHSTSGSSLQDPGVAVDQVSRSEYAQRLQETQLTNRQNVVVINQEEQMMSLATSGSSLTSDGGSSESVTLMTDCVTNHKEDIETRLTKPRAIAATANIVMAEQANKEIQLGYAASDSNFTALVKNETLQYKTVVQMEPTRRPSRAAATAGMARQVKQEGGSLEMLISSALELEDMDADMEIHHNTKKRTTEGPARAPKRSRGATKVLQNTLEIKSAGQNLSRGKKRRQAATYEAGLVEASPIITDIPPLPFTSTSPELRLRGRNKSKSKQNVKFRTKLTHSVREMDSYEDRHCEYCKKVANICVLMHCHACRRVYHAQCFVHAFKPYVDESVSIFGQMERLQLEVPDRRGNIFRCASCKAAFLDFYEGGGYMWDCNCPTCSQPEKIVFYRQRKLVQMMNNMELEKQRKKEQKDQRKNGTFNASGKPPVSARSRSNSTSRSRHIRGSSTTPDDYVVSSQKLQILTSGTRGASTDGHELTKLDPVGEPEQSQLVGDDLVDAVQILRDDNNGGWCFPVMCSRTLSLRESGVMKTGKCKWLSEKNSLIQCNCCDNFFNHHEFVHHTDSSLKNAKATNGNPMPFLFVEHRNAAQHTLLEHFLPALRDWSDRQSVKNAPTEPHRSCDAKQEVLAFAGTPSMTMANPDTITDVLQTPVSRLQALALFKWPKLKSDKSSTASRLTDSATLNFVAQVVCLSPSYVINMQNGTLADRIVRSKTTAPGDSFPRKAGWLPFNRKPASARQITCFCCEQNFSFDDFVGHAGISLCDLKKRSRQLLYIVERQDESALVPYRTFVSDLEFITTNGVDMFLDKLPPPPPRPI